MTKQELALRLQTMFKIEQSDSSLDYLEEVVNQAIERAESTEQIDKILEMRDNMVKKYNMEVIHGAVTEYIAETLLLNMTVEQIEYVVNCYSSEVYNKFFGIMGNVLDEFSYDLADMLDVGLGVDIKPRTTEVLM